MPAALEQPASGRMDADTDSRTRRSGGREARRALRAAPLSDDIRPVRAGLEGGNYRPLTGNDIERIHEAVLTVLETVGFANAIPHPPAAGWLLVHEARPIGTMHRSQCAWLAAAAPADGDCAPAPLSPPRAGGCP